MNRYLPLICCFLLFAPALQAQNAANPFELIHRLPKVAVTATGTTATATTATAAIAATVNPFDVIPHRAPGIARGMVENATQPFKPFSIMPRGGGMSPGFLFWTMVAMFALLTLSVAANRNAVGKVWRGFLNDSSLTLAQRESAGLVGSAPYYLLYVNFILQVGMFLFLVIRFFKKDDFNNPAFLLICMLASALMFLSKHAMLALTAWLIKVGTVVQRYNFLILIFNCILGLFLVPFNLLLAFSGEYQGLLVFWMLGLAAIFYLYRTLRSSVIGSKFLADDQFHFLLYLCTVEIAPVLLVIKLAMMQTN
jgi:hypothetical protein